jgi:predicted TIM-barrel enzyme
MDEGLFTTCSLMLGLCHLCPMKPDMQAEQRAVWQDIMESARSNARQLIMSMLEALRSCTTELDVYGAMFGLTVGEETLDQFISSMATRVHERIGSGIRHAVERLHAEKWLKPFTPGGGRGLACYSVAIYPTRTGK